MAVHGSIVANPPLSAGFPALPIAFEPIDRPTRLISREPPPSAIRPESGWLMGPPCTSKPRSDCDLGSPPAICAVALPAFSEFRCFSARLGRAWARQDLPRLLGRISHEWPSLRPYPGRDGTCPDPCRHPVRVQRQGAGYRQDG